MKIINRLYFKVILIAVVLIAGFVGFYYMDIYYQNISQRESKKIERNREKIGDLEKKVVKYKSEVASLKDIKQYLKRIEKQTTEDKNEVSNAKEIKQYLKKIATLEKQSAEYKSKIKTLQAIKCKITLDVKKRVILKNIAKIDKKQIRKSKKTEPKVMDKYRKALMYNIHNQIVQELHYAPYLPVSQLQEMMAKRFHLESMHFQICICENSGKKFDGIRITPNKTESVIRDSALLEVRFDTK